MYIMANKLDLKEGRYKPNKQTSGRRVTAEEGKELGEKYGAEFFEASAKSGENVLPAFVAVARGLVIQEQTFAGGAKSTEPY